MSKAANLVPDDGSEQSIEELRAEIERLRKTALLDPETGVYNRNHGEALIIQFRSLRERHARPVAGLLFSADSVNSAGPGTGVAYINELATLVRKSLRASDNLIKWTEDHFLVLLPESSRSNALTAGEKIRSVVEKHVFVGGLRLTLSVGVSDLVAGESVETFIARLFMHFQAAQMAGGNQTRAFVGHS